jgi:hypothetical protein
VLVGASSRRDVLGSTGPCGWLLPARDAAELVGRNHSDAVVTLGDLQPDWIASLGTLDLPRLGLHGNHDGEDELATLGIRLHLSRAQVGGWSFAGFEGCVRYRDGPISTRRRRPLGWRATWRPLTCCCVIARPMA